MFSPATAPSYLFRGQWAGLSKVAQNSPALTAAKSYSVVFRHASGIVDYLIENA